jgi:predicted GNAT superfamily acetyltransferase
VTTDSIEIRKCQGIEELRAAVDLQKEVWNFTDAELVPLRLFVVAEKVGGRKCWARSSGKTWSVLRWPCPGCAPDIPTPALAHVGGPQDYRNGGLGRRIKLYQREEALGAASGLISGRSIHWKSRMPI